MRKILRAKTIGSQAEGNLQPIIATILPQGVNMTVHLYNEVENTCILELWGSNKEFLKPNDRINTAKLNTLLEHNSVLEQLANHPSSPKKLYGFSERADHFEEIDDVKKIAKKDGKEYSFKRVEKRKRHGEEIEMIVLEEE